MCNSRLSTKTLALLAATAAASMLSAQEQATPEVNPNYEEVIVTGTKQGLSVQDTVTSVSVYNEERLDREVVFELDDIFLRTANVASPGFTGGISIRGIQRNGVGFAGTGNTSNIYVNGAPLSDLGTGGIETLWDVEQIEILRGPQSTVQGRNSLAGAIVIKTKRPSYEFNGGARIRAAELGTRQYSAALGGPIVDEQLAGRFSVDRQEYDGDVRYASTGELSHITDGTTYRGSLLWEPKAIEDFSVYLIAERIETFVRDTAIASSPGALGSPEQIAFDPFHGISHSTPQSLDYVTDRFIAELEYQLNDSWGVYLLGTFEDSKQDRLFGDLEDLTRFDSNGEFDANTDTTSVELRFEYSSEKLNGRIGAYYFEEDPTNTFTGFLLLSQVVPVIPNDSVAKVIGTFSSIAENNAIFGELRYDFSDQWSVELGMRYDEEENLNPGLEGSVEVNPPSCVVAPFIPNIGGAPCAALLRRSPPDLTAAKFDAFLPRAAVTYNIDEDRSLSFSVQRGYRAGGAYIFVDSARGRDAEPELRTFDPEFITNYELAFRSQWFERALTFNANLYLSKWEDQQVTLLGPTGIQDSRTVNVGKSELRGLEIETQWNVTENFELFGTLGLSDNEFVDFPYAITPAGTPIDPANPRFANLKGNEFQISPGTTASIGAYYKMDNGLFVDVTLSYQDGGYSDVFNLDADTFESQTITNLRFGYDLDNWRFFAYANNLFDDRAITESNFQNVNADNTIETFPNPFIRVNKPRVLGAAIEYSF